MNSYFLLATMNLALGGLVILLGILILRENPRQKLNLVVAMMLFFGGLGSILGALGFVEAHPGLETEGGPVSRNFYENFAYLWEFFFPALLLFASVFPRERPFTRKFRGFPILVFTPHVFHFILIVTMGWFLPEDALPGMAVPALLQPFVTAYELISKVFLSIHRALFSLVNLIYGGLAAGLLYLNYRDADDRRIKQQIRVIGAGLTACLACYSAATLIPTLLNLELQTWFRAVLTTVALLASSGAITYSIVRHKFLDTKLFARRAILYAVASAILVGFYLLIVARLNQFFTRISGADADVFEPVFLILALILFQPAVSRLETGLESLFLRDPADYRNVLTRLGREILTTIDLDLLLARSIRTVTEALGLRSGYIVALAREGPLIHGGAGESVPQDAVDLLPELLNRLSGARESYRISGPEPQLGERDHEFLSRVFEAELVVPLRTKGEIVGALILGSKITGTEYTSEDVSLLSSLATQLAVSLQNGLLLRDRVAVARFEEELNLARQIQRSFLPSEFPRMARLDIHATSIPSKEVGGDLYDVVQVDDRQFFLAIGDVSGKGVPAALLSSMLQASLRTQAGSVFSVGRILGNINNLVYKSTSSEQFATFFLAHVDQETMRLSFSNAGHNHPLLFRDGDARGLEKGGVVLGVLGGAEFEEGTVDLKNGDRIILYTDGISEARNEDDEEFGEERLQDLVHTLPKELTAHEVTELILEDLYGFLGEQEAQDDVTLMVLRVLEPETSASASSALSVGGRSEEA